LPVALEGPGIWLILDQFHDIHPEVSSKISSTGDVALARG
jgi:hypothetical protein